MSDNFKNIDDFIRDKFENFEQDPPDYVWEKVKAGIARGGSPGGPGSNRGGLAGFTAILIIIGTLMVYLLSNSFTIKPSTNINNQDLAGYSSVQGFSAPSFEGKVPNNIPLKDENTLSITESLSSTTVSAENLQQLMDPDNTFIVSENQIGKSSLVVATHSQITNPKQEEIAQTSNPDLSLMKYRKFETLQSNISSKSNFKLKNKTNEFGSVVTGKPDDKYVMKGEWSVGLFFIPEMIRYPSDDKLTNYARGIDLHLIYKKNNYILQTGLGLSQFKDAGNYKIDYNKYLGSYEDVYNVIFDTIDGEVMPVYQTQTVDVYDSINYVKISPTERKFTYLQIPLLVGYGEEYRRFGWFIKTGPALSLMVHENIPEASLSEDQFKILNTENSLPARINANWQFMLSFGGTYKLGNKINLSVEPLMRYYINPDYEPGKTLTKHPYSIGLRTGLLINL